LSRKNNNTRYVPTDKPGLIRDTFTQAILSSDTTALYEYRIRAQKIKENHSKLESINTVKDDMDILKDEMSEIKNLLKQIILDKETNTDAN
jgi:hypothetical protein